MLAGLMLETEKRAAFSLALVYALRMLGLFMILPVFSVYAETLGDSTPLLAGIALGIYGLISFSVAQRQKELGVRIALGASRAEIRRVVVGDGLKLTSVGLAAGLIAAIGLAQLVSATLFGVSPFDPVTLGGVLILFLGMSALASFVTAARASRTDPIGVLRAE